MARTRKKKEKIPSIVDTRNASKETRNKIHGTVQASNDAAHNILDIAKETNKLANDADETVHEQGAQIDDITDQMADVQLQTKKAEKKVGAIRSLWRAFVYAITPKCLQPSKTELDEVSVDEIQTTQDQQKHKRGSTAEGSSGPAVTFLFDEKTQKVEDDTYQTLASASDVLDEMNKTARRTNRELRRQNQRLDQAQEIGDDTNKRLNKANKGAKKYLKS